MLFRSITEHYRGNSKRGSQRILGNRKIHAIEIVDEHAKPQKQSDAPPSLRHRGSLWTCWLLQKIILFSRHAGRNIVENRRGRQGAEWKFPEKMSVRRRSLETNQSLVFSLPPKFPNTLPQRIALLASAAHPPRFLENYKSD